MSGDVIDFGFDDGKVIKQSGMEKFIQTKNDVHRVSIIAFKKFHDTILADKAREKGDKLDEKEIAEFTKKIDGNLAEKLGKSIDDLTEVDRLDITKPKFSFAFTHYSDGVGTIRCLSEFQGLTMTKPGLCCNKIGDPDQTVAVPIMTYPVDEDYGVDEDLLSQKKYTGFYIWKLSSKKFKRVESAYKAAREDKQMVIDLKVALDGEQKYQKQIIEKLASAFWARDNTDPTIKQWILEQGLRARKYAPDQLGYAMKPDQLAERLGMVSSSGDEEKPQLQTSYSSLLE
jgi:hypothetical protein